MVAVAPGAIGPGKGMGTSATLNQVIVDPAGSAGGGTLSGKCTSRESATPLTIADCPLTLVMRIAPHTFCPSTNAVLLTLTLAAPRAATLVGDPLVRTLPSVRRPCSTGAMLCARTASADNAASNPMTERTIAVENLLIFFLLSNAANRNSIQLPHLLPEPRRPAARRRAHHLYRPLIGVRRFIKAQ
jgi:hypothetical protein